jgi:hypothetical protein
MKTSSRIGAAGRPESWTVTGGWRWPSHVRSPMTSAPAGKGSVSRLENNVVMLAGTVGSWQVRATAGDLARRTAGAFDLCNALRVDGDAPDRRQVDAFTELVASVPEPRPPMAVSRAWPRAGRSGRVMLFLVLLVWLGLLLGIAGGLPVCPLVIAAVVAAIVIAAFRYADHRASRG